VEDVIVPVVAIRLGWPVVAVRPPIIVFLIECPTNTGTSYNQLQSLEDNSILGSGNFEILKGGTFYEEDDYRRPYSNNRPAQPYSYYGNNDIFHNFRDFADIKGDRKNNGYEEGFYYR
jgi:hypothetical protein